MKKKTIAKIALLSMPFILLTPIIFSCWFLGYFYLFLKVFKLSKNTQLMINTRSDLGPILTLLNYARCWRNLRGDVAVLDISYNPLITKMLAPYVCPKLKVIYLRNYLFNNFLKKVFDVSLVEVLNKKTLSLLVKDRLNSICIFDSATPLDKVKASYNFYFDENIVTYQHLVTPAFLEAYKKYRSIMEYHYYLLKDAGKLNVENNSFNCISKLEKLRSELLIKLQIQNPYIVFNVNSKNRYCVEANNRKINYPDRYNVLIDYFISKGYNVVIQGRSEQPIFKRRKGLIDYSKSCLCSPANDLALFSGAKFAVVNKTGPENFAMICNLPILSLDFTEWNSVAPHNKSRFFPKQIINIRTGRALSWKVILTDGCFFHVDKYIFSEMDLKYEDMKEEEILMAGEEFHELVLKKDFTWDDYSPMQKEFKNYLNPFHLDLYDNTKSVPCDCYLKVFS